SDKNAEAGINNRMRSFRKSIYLSCKTVLDIGQMPEISSFASRNIGLFDHDAPTLRPHVSCRTNKYAFFYACNRS
ncbi:MAG: hypothetical protein ACYTFQ_31340, partial [Planctomycetota bacterium]